MVDTELITEKNRKYIFSSNSTVTVNAPHYDIILFILTINNFTSSKDSGYYRCQVMVNNSCLDMSHSGQIFLNESSLNNCESYNQSNFIYYELPEVCREVTLCTEMATPPHFTIEYVTENQQNGLELSNGTSETTFVTNAGGAVTLELSLVMIQYIVIGVLCFIIVLLLLVILACFVNSLRKSRYKKQQKGT